MRRWILLLLLVLMPHQAVWSSTAPYCGHESQGSVAHFGHHQHSHRAVAVESEVPPPAFVDLDCATCHFSKFTPIAELVVIAQPPEMGGVPPYQASLYVSCHLRWPERPPISGAPPAVRSGGGGALAL